jgi:hypothetical protein
LAITTKGNHCPSLGFHFLGLERKEQHREEKIKTFGNYYKRQSLPKLRISFPGIGKGGTTQRGKK